MNRSTTRWIAAVVVFIAGAIGAWLLAPSRSPIPIGRVYVQPDGTRMRLEAVTYGNVHLPGATVWQRVLVRAPSWLQRLARVPPPRRYTSRKKELILWFSKPVAGGYFETYVTDEQRRVWSPSTTTTSFQPLPGIEWRGAILSVLPRRSERIVVGLACWSEKGQETFGELTLANPAHTRVAAWTPSARPVSVTNGDIVLTVTQLVTGVNIQQEGRSAATNVADSGVRLGYTVTERGRPTHGWMIIAAQGWDVTGNDVSASLWMRQEEHAGQGFALYQPSLWPNDGWRLASLWPNDAWRLKIELTRSKSFPPDEVLAVRGLKPVLVFSDSWEIAWTNTTAIVRTNWGAQLVEVIACNRCSGDQTNLAVCLRLPDLDQAIRLDLIAATNHLGRKVPVGMNSSGWNAKTLTREFGFDGPGESLDADFAISPRKIFDLVVRPELIATNGH